MLRIALVALSGVLAFSACGDDDSESGDPSSAGVPEASEILFVQWEPRTEDQNSLTPKDLATMPADGGEIRILSETPEIYEEEPARSPDGSQIVYSNVGDLEVVEADGEDRTVLTESPFSIDEPREYDSTPSWSPDGDTILFTRIVFPADVEDENYVSSLMTIDAGGGEPQHLDVSSEATDGVWSPDGSKLAFVELPIGEIAVADADGRNPRRLTDVRSGHGGASFLDWSPDGTRIAFTTGDGELFVMDADGSNLQMLTEGFSFDPAAAEVAEDPVWSVDGSDIFFERFLGPPGKFVFGIAADGSGEARQLARAADIPEGYADHMTDPDVYSESEAG